ncbi:MAG TPA: glycosyltransferase family 4 protein [Candidatus Omnitrophota bacterium]|nr:glycosyltransferase family 4 protein [Candidatus Omnitrophota bacterium]HPN57385.1 glycosyltransferase family 4 protein [Candidatus Omnitrophota bacterium]
MVHLLTIGLDYLMLQGSKVRGDVRLRQFDYAKSLASLDSIVYSPRGLNLTDSQWAENFRLYPTQSRSKAVFMFDAYKIAVKICREKQIDVISAEDPFITGLVGYFLKRKFDIPLNVQAHIDFVDNPYWMSLRPINRLFNSLGKFICKKADTIRVVASETQESLEKCGVAADKISLISVHSDLSHFQALDGSEIRAKYKKEGFEQILLFVGRLVHQKDIPNLFGAFKYVLKEKPKTVLLLAGEGPLKTEMELFSEKEGIAKNVRFVGSVDHAEIQKYYSACDIFVLPSIFEGRATVIVEAILSKKPIVSTDVSGLREWLVNGETGFVVPRKDPKALADKVVFLLNNPDKIVSFGRKGYEVAQKNLKVIGDISSMIALWEKTAVQGRKTHGA